MKAQLNPKITLVKCPHCGAEYLPGELYMPGSLIGKPEDVLKDCFGRVLYADYATEAEEPDMIEHFVCEYCEKPFIIEATVTYKTREELPENDFSTQYVSLLD